MHSVDQPLIVQNGKRWQGDRFDGVPDIVYFANDEVQLLVTIEIVKDVNNLKDVERRIIAGTKAVVHRSTRDEPQKWRYGHVTIAIAELDIHLGLVTLPRYMVRKLPKAVIGRDALEADTGTHEDDILLNNVPDNRQTLLQSQVQSVLFNGFRNKRSTDLAKHNATLKAIVLQKEGPLTVA